MSYAIATGASKDGSKDGSEKKMEALSVLFEIFIHFTLYC